MMMQTYIPNIIVADDDHDFGIKAADHFFLALEAAKIENPLIILPTGNTPLPFYEELVRRHHEVNLPRFRYLQLDEYIGLKPDDPRLFQREIAAALLDRIHHPKNLRFTFNTMSCKALPNQVMAEAVRMSNLFSTLRPLHISVLGVGLNGHIGFNEPRSSFLSAIRPVTLSKQTRKANAGQWDNNWQHVPERAITLGLNNLKQAQKTIVLIRGRHKAAVLDKIRSGPVTEKIPATLIKTMPNVTIIADRAAMGMTP